MTVSKQAEASAVEHAREVLDIEARAIEAARRRLGGEVQQATQLILACRGRVVVTGIGKSGTIAQKIASTLSSTGTPALFLHSGEGVHGDLGMVTTDDVLIALSYSGESDEVGAIVPAIKRMGIPIIAFTGRPESALGSAAEVVIDCAVEQEACPLGLAPTASTTVMLALGDALAIALMRARNFGAADFARRHPAGSLGRRLLLTAADVMRTGDEMVTARPADLLKDVLFAITKPRAGCALMVDDDGKLIGIITDGDVRRALVSDEHALRRPAGDFMVRGPKTIAPTQLAAEALRLAVEGPFKIADLPVVGDDGKPVGVINIKDLLSAGLV